MGERYRYVYSCNDNKVDDGGDGDDGGGGDDDDTTKIPSHVKLATPSIALSSTRIRYILRDDDDNDTTTTNNNNTTNTTKKKKETETITMNHGYGADLRLPFLKRNNNNNIIQNPNATSTIDDNL